MGFLFWVLPRFTTFRRAQVSNLAHRSDRPSSQGPHVWQPQRIRAEQYGEVRPAVRGGGRYIQPLNRCSGRFLRPFSRELPRRPGFAIINSVGDLGGFFAQNAVPWIRDRTGRRPRTDVVPVSLPDRRRPDDLLRASGDSAASSRSGCSCLKRGESKGRLEAENAPAPAGYTPHNHTNAAPSHECARSVLYRSDGSAR